MGGEPGKSFAERKSAAIALRACLPAGLFLFCFAILLVMGKAFFSTVSNPIWACVIAGIVTLPLLAPWIATELLPRITSLKISEFEIAMDHGKAATNAVKDAANTINANLAGGWATGEFAGRMTSLSHSIIDAVREIRIAGHEVVPIDLSNTWLAPNLYFLAMLLDEKTKVKQIAFVDSRIEPDRFVCASSPAEVFISLELRYPELRQAAERSRTELHPRSIEPLTGMDFFSRLGAIYNPTAEGHSDNLSPLTPETLLWLLGSAAHLQSVQWNEPAGEKEYEAVVRSESAHVAALQGNQLQFMVSRERVAVAVARAAVGKTS